VNQQFTLKFFVGFTPLNTEYYYGLLLISLPMVFLVFPGTERAAGPRALVRPAAVRRDAAVSIYLMFNIRKSAELGWEFAGAPAGR
jgi:hypothetical protein